MPHRVIAAALLGTLLSAAPGLAGEPPLPAPALPKAPAADAAPAWPTELKHRNARYASLTRVDDPSGDVHERLIAHMQMNRVTDHVGDLEEVRRKRTTGFVPPLAVKDALVMREQDVGGDDNEVVLASIRHERRHAETRRFRDLAGDSTELADYKRDQKRIRLEREDRIVIGRDGVDESRARYLDDRDTQEDRETGASVGEAERAETRVEDEVDRALAREEREQDRDSLQPGGDEAELPDPLDEAGLGVGDPLDEIGEDADVRMEESELERETEAQLEQEEAGAGGSSTP